MSRTRSMSNVNAAAAAMIKDKCRQCGRSIGYPASARNVKCPYCQHRFRPKSQNTSSIQVRRPGAGSASLSPSGGGPSYQNDQTVLKEGWLQKKNQLVGWGRRFFQCTDSELRYYNKTTSLAPKKIIPGGNIINTRQDTSPDGFIVFTFTKTHRLKADSESERKEWVSCINELVQLCQRRKSERKKRSSMMHQSAGNMLAPGTRGGRAASFNPGTQRRATAGPSMLSRSHGRAGSNLSAISDLSDGAGGRFGPMETPRDSVERKSYYNPPVVPKLTTEKKLLDMYPAWQVISQKGVRLRIKPSRNAGIIKIVNMGETIVGWPPVYIHPEETWLQCKSGWACVDSPEERRAAPQLRSSRWAARSSVPILEGPSPNKRQIGALKRGDAITAKEMVVTPRDESNGTMDMIWLRHKHGYSCMLFDGKFLMKPYKKKSKKSKKTWKRKGDGKVVTFEFEITKPMGLVMSKRGVVLNVSKKSQALAHGVQAGWQMFAINGKDINNQKTMNERLQKMYEAGHTSFKVSFEAPADFQDQGTGAPEAPVAPADGKDQKTLSAEQIQKAVAGLNLAGPLGKNARLQGGAPALPVSPPRADRKLPVAPQMPALDEEINPPPPDEPYPGDEDGPGPAELRVDEKAAKQQRSGPGHARNGSVQGKVQLMTPNRDVPTTWTGDSDSSDEELASDFICPLTQEPFRDPVMTEDGQSYERAAIVDWLSRSDLSPMTNVRLSTKNLIANIALRNAVENALRERDRRKRRRKADRDARDAEAKEAEATTSSPIEDEKVEPRQGVDEGKHATDGLQDAQMFDAAPLADAPPPVDARVLPKGDDGDSSSSSSSDSEDTVDEDDAPPDMPAPTPMPVPSGNAPSPPQDGPAAPEPAAPVIDEGDEDGDVSEPSSDEDISEPSSSDGDDQQDPGVGDELAPAPPAPPVAYEDPVGEPPLPPQSPADRGGGDDSDDDDISEPSSSDEEDQQPVPEEVAPEAPVDDQVGPEPPADDGGDASDASDSSSSSSGSGSSSSPSDSEEDGAPPMMQAG